MGKTRKSFDKKSQKKEIKPLEKSEELCPHGRSLIFCCQCRYGDISRSAGAFSRTRDLLNDLLIGEGYKLIKAWNMMREDEEEEGK